MHSIELLGPDPEGFGPIKVGIRPFDITFGYMLELLRGRSYKLARMKDVCFYFRSNSVTSSVEVALNSPVGYYYRSSLGDKSVKNVQIAIFSLNELVRARVFFNGTLFEHIFRVLP